MLKLLFILALPALSGADTNVPSLLNSQNVLWDVPGPGSAQSMPLGNGDIGLNVWVEPSGDLCFYIGKTDAWGEDVRASKGLMKLGKLRISLYPKPLGPGAAFSQLLRLHEAEIQVKEGPAEFRVWVDANHPVIRVEMKSSRAEALILSLEDWRGDRLLPALGGGITWYHRNAASADPHVANLTFGGRISGAGLRNKGASSLASAAGTAQLVSIYPLTAQAQSPELWMAQLEQQASALAALDLEQSRQAHQKWWDQFWQRSWVFVSGQAAAKVTQGYVLQRFITACAGRGAYPIKFNGSIFVVDDPSPINEETKSAVSADFRRWGGQYWFQNTRAMYWPRLMAGDFDLMQPLFRMYAAQLAPNAAQVKDYYHHDGAYFAETAPFWGGLKYMGPEVHEDWTGHYFTPILELSMMMLDYYEYTGDLKFARETLLPVASAGLEFFDRHFKRDPQGKLLLDPDNSIEMFWKVHDPAPDIAGLHAVLRRMIALPAPLVDAATRLRWQRFLAEIPPLPRAQKKGRPVLLPYTGPQTAEHHNGENPELYAVFPFRLFGLGKPDLATALSTFEARACRQKGCWVQDPMQAALLGLADVAREYVAFALTSRDARLKFPAFWAQANDYHPDQDNGGNGEDGLQLMLMQCEGRKILLLPAWPRGWDAEFKLHAPYNTTVQGKVELGRLSELVVTPPQRRADVVDMSQARP